MAVFHVVCPMRGRQLMIVVAHKIVLILIFVSLLTLPCESNKNIINRKIGTKSREPAAFLSENLWILEKPYIFAL